MQQVFIAAKEAWLPHCNDSCVIPLPSSCCGFSPESCSQLKCGMQYAVPYVAEFTHDSQHIKATDNVVADKLSWPTEHSRLQAW
jgi:hypothetical protein